MGNLIRDLTLRFVVLGWLYAKNAQKTPPKGHNFQVNPPIQVVGRLAGGTLGLLLGLQAIRWAIRCRIKSQAPSTSTTALS